MRNEIGHSSLFLLLISLLKTDFNDRINLIAVIITKNKRKLLAESLTKAAEYIFALLILGQFISGEINILAIVFSVIMYMLLVIIAMIVIPEDEEG